MVFYNPDLSLYCLIYQIYWLSYLSLDHRVQTVLLLSNVQLLYVISSCVFEKNDAIWSKFSDSKWFGMHRRRGRTGPLLSLWMYLYKEYAWTISDDF